MPAASWTTLMALSQQQTQATQSAVEQQLAERKRKEAARRREVEERERKEREKEAKLRLQRLESDKREREREERHRQEEEARERVLERQKQAQRERLLGVKKARTSTSAGSGGEVDYPKANGHAREEVRRQRMPSPSSGDAAAALTREELRARKSEAVSRRVYGAVPRRSGGSAFGKVGRRLPGGAVNMTVDSGSQAGSSSSGQSVKQRLAATPNALMKLNTVKRDTRTIDEIVQDIQRAKGKSEVTGDGAKEFNDWFSTSKKKEPAKRLPLRDTESPLSGANSPAHIPSTSQVPMDSKKIASRSTGTGSSTPVSRSSVPMKASSASAASGKAGSTRPEKPSSSSKSRALSDAKPSASFFTSAKVSSGQVARPSSLATPARKRPRSPSPSPSMSESPSPPSSPAKRNRTMHGRGQEPSSNDISTEIWRLFGKDKRQYTARDIDSDDEDMEADTHTLEREEKLSMRYAKREDEIALEEERKHEEEKRRRRKEREARERRD